MSDQAGAHTPDGPIDITDAVEKAFYLGSQETSAMADELERLKTQVATVRKEALDEAWRAVDAQRKIRNPDEYRSDYEIGFDDAIGWALTAIGRLGGRDPSAGIYAEVVKLRAEKAQMLEALKNIVEVGTKFETVRIGDALSEDGWENYTTLSEEAKIARAAILAAEEK